MSRQPPHHALIVLTRYPRPGRVKTRLAATLGDEIAAEFSRLSAERLLAESVRLPENVRRYLFFDDPADAARVRGWVGEELRLQPQVAGTFGERLAATFHTVFAEGARKAVIVGSDIPDLTAALVEEAFRLLDHYPLVIGPDHGGGYYLLGMKMLYQDLFFRDLSWGTGRVLGQTLRIMQELDLVPTFLPPLIDVDNEGDLRRWLESREAQQEQRLERYLRRQLGSQAEE